MHDTDSTDQVGFDPTVDGVSPCEFVRATESAPAAPTPPDRPTAVGDDGAPIPRLPLARLPDWIGRAQHHTDNKRVNLAEEADYYRLKMACQKLADGVYASDMTPTTTTVSEIIRMIEQG